MRYGLLSEILLTGAAFAVMTSTVQAQPEMLTLNKNTSHYMNMNQPITRIAIGGNKDFATVVQLPGSTSEFLIVTKKDPGTTTLFVWTADGVRHEYIITVSEEDPGQALLIEQAIGLPDVHVRMVGTRVLLTGTVENQYEKNYVLQTVSLFINGSGSVSLNVNSGLDTKLDVSDASSSSNKNVEITQTTSSGEIIDLLQIRNPLQVRLEAQIIEINTEDAKQLGLQYGTGSNIGTFAFGEGYTRDSHTTITETSSDNWSRNYSGDWTDSYSGDSSNGYSGTRYSYTGDTNGNYTNSLNNGWSNGYDNDRNGGRDWSGGNSFSRSVNVSYADLVGFANNPLKWIGQHFAPVNMTLSALVTKGKAKVLSRPSVTTLIGEQATIQIGGQIPYSTYSDTGRPLVQFKDYGIILQFRPIIDTQKRITSMVHTEVSNISGQAVDGQPIIAKRSADAVVNLHSGETMVIGGLMDSSESRSVQKIPLLGDIPILGEFFKHTSKSRDKRELIILVTPRIVGEDDAGQTYWSPTMREWYGLDQKYREAMERVDFNRPKAEDDPTPKVDEPFTNGR